MRRVYSERQISATFIAAGSKKTTMPDPDEIRASFDRTLQTPPKLISSEEREWMLVMGLA